MTDNTALARPNRFCATGGAAPSIARGARRADMLSEGHCPSITRHRMVTGMATTSIKALRIVSGSPNSS